MAGSAPKYKMSIGLNVLDHLGLNLYSNIPAVVAEAVANSWDADAALVEITVDSRKKLISILDDGVGMSLNDVNSKFLHIGYQRRKKDPIKTEKYGRHVMGRKGIGKLSLFSIANRIEVYSSTSPTEKNAFALDAEKIRAHIERDEHDYHPEEIDSNAIDFNRGTRVLLRNLRVNPTKATVKALRRRLARRFSIIGSRFKFRVSVNGDAIGPEDRDYFNKIEYLWSIGPVGDVFEKAAKKAVKKSKLSGTVDEDNEWTVQGWIGTFDERRNVEEEQNTISVHAWGKLVQEDILGEINAGQLFTKYLIGELHADFLDDDDLPDITTSDRQRLKETDPRYEALFDFVAKTIIPEVDKYWTEWRQEGALSKALENPAVKEWFGSLSGDHRKFAKQLFGKIGRLNLSDDEDRRELYRHAILAFERLSFKNLLSVIESMEEEHVVTALESVFAEIDELEAAEYHQIAKGRLEVIDKFVGIATVEKEKIVQQYLFDHLWLLSPSWERGASNAHMEKAIKQVFRKLDAKLSAGERKARLDIAYRTSANKHVVIELKKYDVSVSIFDLAKQVNKYFEAVGKCLREKFNEQESSLEIIAVLGKPPTGTSEAKAVNMLKEFNARYITYDSLIREAQDSYRQYLEANERISRISSILDKI
jgi:hypothetical protein